MARKGTPEETRLDADVTTPSTTAPGDGAADTTDPTEQASTVGGDKLAAAQAGHLTVNAAVPVEGLQTRSFSDASLDEDSGRNGSGRIETYPAMRADGSTVTVTHNLDTGETSVK